MRAILALLSAVFAGSALADPQISLKATFEEGAVRVQAHVAAKTAFKGRAKLTLERSGASGLSKSSQGSEIGLDPNGQAPVATVRVSFAPGDSLTANAELMNANGDVIAVTTLALD